MPPIMRAPVDNAVCVYCASNLGTQAEFREAAESLGIAIARAGMTLIYGGGDRGLMGAVSAACRTAGGKTLGYVPRVIAEGGGEGSYKFNAMPIVPGETILVNSMHERKTRMAEAAEAGFFGLPGGFGTFEEILEAITWVQLGIHEKPVILLNVNGYYNPLKQLIDGGVKGGVIAEVYAGIVKFVDRPEDEESFDWGEAGLEALAAWAPPKTGPLFTWENGLSES